MKKRSGIWRKLLLLVLAAVLLLQPQLPMYAADGGDIETPEISINEGWTKEGGDWYFYENGQRVKNQWRDSCWLKEDGRMAVSEWVDEGRYYVGKTGYYIPNRWMQNEKGWWYQYGDGTYPTNCWKQIDGDWYHFNVDGYVQTGWYKENGNWYYLKPNGKKAVSQWVNSDQYVNAEGIWVPNQWMQNKKGWWFQLGDGTYPTNCWRKINDEWYHFNAAGYMQTGWLKDGDKWYYLKANGTMAKSQWVEENRYVNGSGVWVPNQWMQNEKGWWYRFGDGTYPANKWETINGKKYHFNASGYMQTGWLKDGDDWYYLNADGSMASNCWIDQKYLLREDGRWDQDILPPVTMGRVSASGTNHMDIHWDKVDGAEGYRIYRKSGSDWIQVGEVHSGGTTQFTDSSCTYGQTYTYMVKAYKLKNGSKIFGGFFPSGSTGRLAYSSGYVNGYKLYYDADGYLIRNVDNIIGKQSSYEIVVYRESCVTTIYAKDGSNGYIIPVKSCICSPGEGSNTVLGTFYTPEKFRWKELIGPVYGQWSTRIYGGILFHTVYYYTNGNNTTLSVGRYNRLGSKDSMGCVRLNCADAKWIYDNCPIGTKVTILNSYYESPLGKPSSPQLPSWHTWDPTDPNCRYLCEQNNCH